MDKRELLVLRDVDNPEQWIAELRRYAELAPRLRLRQQRLVRAALDGSWRRLHRQAHSQMAAAVDEANAALPAALQLGFEDPATGQQVRIVREVQPLSRSSV